MSLADAEYLQSSVTRSIAQEELSDYCRQLKAKKIAEECSLDIGDIKSEYSWIGVVDLYDVKEELSPTSIGWTCLRHFCDVEADLPIPANENEEFYGTLMKNGDCGVAIIHEHETVEGEREDHVHVLCSVLPQNLVKTVKFLTNITLKARGSIV